MVIIEINKMNEENKTIQCCVTVCDKPLNADFWNQQYASGKTGWDIGMPSPPIAAYVDKLENKELRILIPGCGNAYEAEYLLDKGFTNITLIDIAPLAVERIMSKMGHRKGLNIILGDFFTHNEKYDLIIEQTFFCALPPQMREMYVWKMFQLLSDEGILTGLLFNKMFDSGPPFGGSKAEYAQLFKAAFHFKSFQEADNSITPRANSELFIELLKNSEAIVSLYNFEGITCSGCRNTIIKQVSEINKVLNVSISSDFSQMLIVSDIEISKDVLEKTLAYDAKYQIKKVDIIA